MKQQKTTFPRLPYGGNICSCDKCKKQFPVIGSFGKDYYALISTNKKSVGTMTQYVSTPFKVALSRIEYKQPTKREKFYGLKTQKMAWSLCKDCQKQHDIKPYIDKIAEKCGYIFRD